MKLNRVSAFGAAGSTVLAPGIRDRPRSRPVGIVPRQVQRGSVDHHLISNTARRSRSPRRRTQHCPPLHEGSALSLCSEQGTAPLLVESCPSHEPESGPVGRDLQRILRPSKGQKGIILGSCRKRTAMTTQRSAPRGRSPPAEGASQTYRANLSTTAVRSPERTGPWSRTRGVSPRGTRPHWRGWSLQPEGSGPGAAAAFPSYDPPEHAALSYARHNATPRCRYGSLTGLRSAASEPETRPGTWDRAGRGKSDRSADLPQPFKDSWIAQDTPLGDVQCLLSLNPAAGRPEHAGENRLRWGRRPPSPRPESARSC
jgi:hypothetical protein